MGILNVTPDSFSDGGQFADADDAVAAGIELVDDGAAMIDIGGESTRPGAERVRADEQIRRVVPVIEGLRAAGVNAPISVDTTLTAVADAALEAGADLVNDIAAGEESPDLLALAAERGAGVILMHRRFDPTEDSYSDQYDDAPEYGDVSEVVIAYLARRRDAALEAGVDADAIVLDPGLGFGKSVDDNYTLIARAPDMQLELGCPVLSAASRKSFIGATTGVKRPSERVAGSIAVTVAQALAGIRLFRVHDVRGHREALDVVCALAPTDR